MVEKNRPQTVRAYWHIARVTNISVGHSASLGVRRSSSSRGGHLRSDCVSRLLPVWNPLPWHSVVAAAQAFQHAYRIAFDRWCNGARLAVFPAGTWLMRVLHRARVVLAGPVTAP